MRTPDVLSVVVVPVVAVVVIFRAARDTVTMAMTAAGERSNARGNSHYSEQRTTLYIVSLGNNKHRTAPRAHSVGGGGRGMTGVVPQNGRTGGEERLGEGSRYFLAIFHPLPASAAAAFTSSRARCNVKRPHGVENNSHWYLFIVKQNVVRLKHNYVTEGLHQF